MYVKHRLRRLPDTPEKIARGIFAGVFTSFTPLYGLHFVVAGLIATVMRGNILASLLATFFGNPLTYVPIGVISLKTGYLLMGLDRPPAEHGNLVTKFVRAGESVLQNLKAYFTDDVANWRDLDVFYHDVFFPYLIGGILPGIICGTIAYYLSVPLLRAYQKRRRGLLKAKLASLKKKKTADGKPRAD
ncbi:hypothetical protein PRI8871_01499 [Pseudoprimorskyibacter insulae]|uniref:DUF2062 domain-containing protein n=2 Tax=Pseudoprimorskyibacter insulae TaxID=1695997 RepID=A0A2R8AUI2_9RHOB|nr:hypothetical protein PRI8871_01499 [Pseudoprimorskyibacter insulae]